jgi:chemotaxis protein CheD
MSELVEVKRGDLAVADSPIVLTTGGIGSCIAICIYSRFHKKGGLAHIMLPHLMDGMNPTEPGNTRFADVAVRVMVEELAKSSITAHQLTAKVVGGANMFPDVQGRSQKVGERNIAAVREIISSYQIPIEAEETGGHTGRAIAFDLSNGIVTINMTI